MSEAPDSSSSTRSNGLSMPVWLVLMGITAALLLFLFRDGLDAMWQLWSEPEYNHGYFIPLIALYLFALRTGRLGAAEQTGSWAGMALVAAGLAMLILGNLSAVYVITQYGFIVTLWGLALAAVGWRGVSVIWPALAYLVFMIPLPRFIQFNLSAQLQLISSQLGVLVIRAFRIPVYLEGNVIDLGIYQLQVADACSGLRYLFPLMSFGFLCAALFQGRWWQRTIIFLSTIPITVLMNSFRIGIIGVLVDHWGIAQAEGFLHYFEGWVVFMACVGILFLEMLLFAVLAHRRFGEVFAVDIPPLSSVTNLLRDARPTRPLIGAGVVIVVALVASFGVGRPAEMAPERATLRTFPLVIGTWRGEEKAVADVYLNELKLTDYLAANYQQPGDLPVDLWVAYYDSQRKGASVHSPRACLPGGGWQMQGFGEHSIAGLGPNGTPLTVNRSLISLGQDRQLVYYWFVQQGNTLTNEYLVKWSIFWSALTKNRTDGALVRLVTPVPDGTDVATADLRLEAFVRAIDPKLAYFLPPKSASLRPVQVAASP